MKQVIISLFLFFAKQQHFCIYSGNQDNPLNDGEIIEARLCLPENEVKTIIFCISGTGPTTYLTKRPTFNFFR